MAHEGKDRQKDSGGKSSPPVYPCYPRKDAKYHRPDPSRFRSPGRPSQRVYERSQSGSGIPVSDKHKTHLHPGLLPVCETMWGSLQRIEMTRTRHPGRIDHPSTTTTTVAGSSGSRIISTGIGPGNVYPTVRERSDLFHRDLLHEPVPAQDP
jgi:hypothetical protein